MNSQMDMLFRVLSDSKLSESSISGEWNFSKLLSNVHNAWEYSREKLSNGRKALRASSQWIIDGSRIQWRGMSFRAIIPDRSPPRRLLTIAALNSEREREREPFNRRDTRASGWQKATSRGTVSIERREWLCSREPVSSATRNETVVKYWI